MTMTEVEATEQVICRNLQPGPTVINESIKCRHEVVFGGRDDPSGEDYQAMPDEIVRTPNFARQLALGTFEVVQGFDHPLIVRALASAARMEPQRDAKMAREAKEQSAILETLEAPLENDLIVINCIGPGTRPGAICGAEIPVRARESGLNPPLCAHHASLSAQCVKRGTGAWALESETDLP